MKIGKAKQLLENVLFCFTCMLYVNGLGENKNISKTKFLLLILLWSLQLFFNEIFGTRPQKIEFFLNAILVCLRLCV